MPSTNPTADSRTENESVTDNERNSSTRAKQNNLFSGLTEDWWAVIIGGVLITAILVAAFSFSHYKFVLPVYQWASAAELSVKVLAAGNLLRIAVTGIIFLVVSSLAIALSGGNAKILPADLCSFFCWPLHRWLLQAIKPSVIME